MVTSLASRVPLPFLSTPCSRSWPPLGQSATEATPCTWSKLRKPRVDCGCWVSSVSPAHAASVVIKKNEIICRIGLPSGVVWWVVHEVCVRLLTFNDFGDTDAMSLFSGGALIPSVIVSQAAASFYSRSVSSSRWSAARAGLVRVHGVPFAGCTHFRIDEPPESAAI